MPQIGIVFVDAFWGNDCGWEFVVSFIRIIDSLQWERPVFFHEKASLRLHRNACWSLCIPYPILSAFARESAKSALYHFGLVSGKRFSLSESLSNWFSLSENCENFNIFAEKSLIFLIFHGKLICNKNPCEKHCIFPVRMGWAYGKHQRNCQRELGQAP